MALVKHALAGALQEAATKIWAQQQQERQQDQEATAVQPATVPVPSLPHGKSGARPTYTWPQHPQLQSKDATPTHMQQGAAHTLQHT